MANTRTAPARLALALAALILTPFGVKTLLAALEEPEPHLMVMLIFSGSLAALAGLTGGVGLAASLFPAAKTENESLDADDKKLMED